MNFTCYSYSGQIRYSIAEDTDIIYIDEMYGQVFLNTSIDKEVVSYLQFTAQARDSANHTVCITERRQLYSLVITPFLPVKIPL